MPRVLLAPTTEPVTDPEELFGGRAPSLEQWLLALAILVGAVVLGLVLRRLVIRTLTSGEDTTPTAGHAIGRVVQMVLVLAGVVYALNTLGVRITPLLGALGIGGLALALATQTILSNAVASVLLQVRRPFRRGDQIATGDFEGTVEDVNFRTVVLRSFEGERVYVPSSVVIDAAIVNHTQMGRRRTTLAVGVHYRTDLPTAQAALLRAVGRVADVLEHPAPEAWVTEFGESSIDFDLRFWHAPDVASLFRVRSAVAVEVKAELDREGIEIPFPQRVVTHVRELADP